MFVYKIDRNVQGLHPSSVPKPACLPGHVIVKTAYAGVNHADVMQVDGRYPLPEETSMIPGLEVSGTIADIGEGVTGFDIGDPVCALLNGGGYGDYVMADARLCLALPGSLSLQDAAALPEALATVWYGLHMLANIQPDEHVIIHGGSSGIGSIAIQLVKYIGAVAYTTVGTSEKQRFCEKLGATTLLYRDAEPMALAEEIKVLSGGGVDIVLDLLGGDYIASNLKMLRYKGRLVSIACMQGANVSMNMAGLLMKNIQWIGMTLRSQPIEVKAHIMRSVKDNLWHAIGDGAIVPTIDRVFVREQAVQSHEYMRSRQHMGKILIRFE